MHKLRNQIRQHSVALISLVVALSSLGYNTWRNELTEANRNVRSAGIELLIKLGDLETVVFYSHYGNDEERGDSRSAWAYALTIRDLGELTHEPAITSSINLVEVWEEDFRGLGKDESAHARIDAAIDQMRRDMLEVLAMLD